MCHYFLSVLLIIPCFLFSQNTTTVLDQLKAGDTLRLEWVHQQYLPDSGSEIGDYPLFPDQMKEGERESLVGLKLVIEPCPTSTCPIKVWVEYVQSSLQSFGKPLETTTNTNYNPSQF